MMWQRVFQMFQCNRVQDRDVAGGGWHCDRSAGRHFGFAFGIKALQIRKMMSTPMVMPPTTVSSATVKEEDWAPTLSAVGSISAVQGAVVSSELGGVVSQIAFENGGSAKKGDLLVQLDASAEEALLRSSEAEAELGRQDLERTRGLASQKVFQRLNSTLRNRNSTG
jgi:Membrane-fusion protein